MKLTASTQVFMVLMASLAISSVAVFGKDDKSKSLYGSAKESAPTSTSGTLKHAYHGVGPARSAFTVNGPKGTALYLAGGGYFLLSDITYVRPLTLNTPFGNAIPGSEYKNEGADPTTPQTFWISDQPINGGYYVIAASDTSGNWSGLTEDCRGRPLLP